MSVRRGSARTRPIQVALSEPDHYEGRIGPSPYIENCPLVNTVEVHYG